MDISNGTHKTLCLGLEHFIDKIGYQSEVYTRNHEAIRYLVSDVSGQSKMFADKYKADVHIVPKNILSRIFKTVKHMMSYKPDIIEIYCTGKLTIIYTLLCKIFNIKSIILLRGTEFNGQNYGNYVSSLRIANNIIAKEFNLLANVEQLGLSYKTNFLYNAVPIQNVSRTYESRDIDILFLNSPRKSRNVLFLVDVIDKLIKLKPDINVTIAGFSILDDKSNTIEIEYQKEVLEKIKDLGLQNRIQVLGFVSNSSELYVRSKIFIFPADIVFCNYSLLESMSYGCVPIVANGEGADKIICNNVNGMILNNNIDTYCKSIIELLEPCVWTEMSVKAKETISNKFSIDAWYRRICQIRFNENI